MISALLLAVTIISHDPGYCTALAKHLQRWLASEQVAAEVVTPKTMGAALSRERLAFLVGFSSPTEEEMNILWAYRRRGGKLVVFHSASPALASLMGVRPVGYQSAPYPGVWSQMKFNTSRALPGAPPVIRQTSTVLQRIRPVNARGGCVLATWADRQGRSTGEPAWIQTDAGFWMSHVLLGDGDEAAKAQLLGAMVGSVDSRAWSYSAHCDRVAARNQEYRAFALKQVPRKGEIHAVWDHSGCGLYPGDWPRTMKVLREARITDLFVNVAGAGFAHYASEVLPRSKIFAAEGDQLAKCLAAAKGSGVRVHAWMLTFSATRAAPSVVSSMEAKGWLIKRPSGTPTDYLDPSHPSVRAYLLSAIEELQAKYPLAGIHLDFIRWGDGLAKGPQAAAQITSFVAEARRRVKRPKWLTTAVYGKYPNCIASVGQDWTKWLDYDLVDYVVPMNYTDSNLVFAELVAQQGATKLRAARTIAGIGVTANESRLTAKEVINQINLLRKFSLAGFSLFDLDQTLENQILPYLKLGIL